MRMKDFGNGNGPQPMAIYRVTTPASEPDKEKEWSVTSKRLARQIQNYCERGFSELEITRKGEQMQTYYEIVPVVARQLQQQQPMANK